MSNEWQRTWELFHAALELPDDARAAFVEARCDGDAVLKSELDSLLAAHAAEQQLLDRAPLVAVEPLALAAGTVLGRYRILSEIGQGGMGRVYLVERSDGEYDKHGALKVLDPAYANDALIDSFLRERQILARLTHPRIARLLDGGRSAGGLPYLVMEYIDGVPIDRHCKAQALGFEATLELAIKVCDSVDFAHRHLIVHRDIKPNNVLVNGAGEPVLLDFGIARQLTAGDARERRGDASALTPAYASPEQLAGEVVGVATDVYSLGVLLYELLVGERPYENGRLQGRELAEHLRKLPSPSLKHAGRRVGLPRRLPPELDWICARAMQPQAAQRYASVAALADDLRALLAHRPVLARGTSLTYALRKLLRRRWPWFAVAAALLAISVLFVWQLDTERRRTADALVATRIERDRAERVVGFLSQLFREADTTQAGGRVVSARELLDRGRSQLEARTDLPAQGRVLLLNALAEVYRNMGVTHVALELLSDAQARSSELDSSALEARTLTNLGSVFELEGRHREARAALTRALDLQRASGDPAAIADAAEPLAITLQALGQKDAAGALFREVYAIRTASLPLDQGRRADAALRLGSWYWVAGQLDRAAQHYDEALQARRAEQPPDLPELARTIDAYGALKHAQGQFAQALSLYQEAVDLRRRVLGAQHRHTADSLSNLGACLFDAGQSAAAEAPLTEALAIYERVLPAGSPVLAKTLNNLALVRHRLHHRDEARALFERALAINRAALGPEHARVAGNLNNLGLVLEEQERLDDAAAAYEQAAKILESTLGAAHPQLAYSLTNLARVRFWQQRQREAVDLFERALAIRRESLAPQHPAQAETLAWYGYAQCRGGDPDAGIAMLERARTIAEAHGFDRSPAPEARAMLGACRLRQGDATGRAAIEAELPGLVERRGAEERLVRELAAAPGR